jgi:hypothetical protein
MLLLLYSGDPGRFEGQGASFKQLSRLIESIGYVGQIDDFTIKPLQ